MTFAPALLALTAAVTMAVLPATPAAADEWDAVPVAVATSLAQGGAAATEARLLIDRSPTAHPDLGAAVMTFGPPLRLLVWGPQDPPLRPEPTTDSLTDTDLSGPVGPRRLAVIFVDGEPHTTLEVDEGGEFIALGGYLPADIEVLAAVESGTETLGAALLGAPDELYRVDQDRRMLTPLNAAARAVVGPEPVSVAEFRQVRARLREIVRPSRLDLPADAVGSASALDEPSRSDLAVPVGVGATAVIVGILVTRVVMVRRRREG